MDTDYDVLYAEESDETRSRINRLKSEVNSECGGVCKQRA